MKKRISEMKAGEAGRLTELTHTGPLRRRLTDLGFTPGTGIRCLGRSPLGDPIAYEIKGTVIALRKKDAAGVAVDTGGDRLWD